MTFRPRCVINPRWAEHAQDAFHESLTTNGVPIKTMATWLQEQGYWPSVENLNTDSAVARFRNSLNGTKGERFRMLEVMALTTRFGGHALLKFWAQSCGFSLVQIPDAEFDAQLVQGLDARLRVMEGALADMRDMRELIERRNAYDEKQESTAPTGRAMFAKDNPL